MTFGPLLIPVASGIEMGGGRGPVAPEITTGESDIVPLDEFSAIPLPKTAFSRMSFEDGVEFEVLTGVDV